MTKRKERNPKHNGERIDLHLADETRAVPDGKVPSSLPIYTITARTQGNRIAIHRPDYHAYGIWAYAGG